MQRIPINATKYLNPLSLNMIQISQSQRDDESDYSGVVVRLFDNIEEGQYGYDDEDEGEVNPANDDDSIDSIDSIYSNDNGEDGNEDNNDEEDNGNNDGNDNESDTVVENEEDDEEEDGEDVDFDFEFDNRDGDIELVSAESDNGLVGIGSVDTILSDVIELRANMIRDEGLAVIELFDRVLGLVHYDPFASVYTRHVTGVPLESVTDTITLTEHHCCAFQVIVYNDVPHVMICGRVGYHQNPNRCRHSFCLRPESVIGAPGRYLRFPRRETVHYCDGDTDRTYHGICFEWTPNQILGQMALNNAQLVPLYHEYHMNRNQQ